jgi:hypothetical protein
MQFRNFHFTHTNIEKFTGHCSHIRGERGKKFLLICVGGRGEKRGGDDGGVVQKKKQQQRCILFIDYATRDKKKKKTHLSCLSINI